MSARPIAWALAAALAGCTVGTIDGPPPQARGREAGPSHGNDLDAEVEEPTAPPPEEEPDAAPAPRDAGGAPPPPTDGGAAPPPAAPDAASDTAPDVAPAPTYPSGPYGTAVGSTFPDLAFNGYRDSAGAWGPVRMGDYYDPTGARGLTGVLVVVSAMWCGPCQEEAKSLRALYPAYKARGARILGGLVEDSYRNPATQKNVDAWIKTFATNYDMVADGTASLLPAGGVGIPYSLVVDPRTMKVVKTWSGADPSAASIPPLDSVIAKNGG